MGKNSRAGKGRGKNSSQPNRNQLADYLRTTLERLSPETFTAGASELKEKIMPSVAESILRLSEGAPDEVREQLNATLLEKKVLPSYDADVDELRAALCDCQDLLASSSAASGKPTPEADVEATTESNEAVLSQSRKGKRVGGHKGDEKGYNKGDGKGASSKGKGRWRGKGDAESTVATAVTSDLSSLKVSFCPDPRSVGAKFTGTYEQSPTCFFGSLNAGDNGFFVGGKTINGQFANDLWNQAWQDTDKYKPLHDRLFKIAKPAELTAASPAVLAGDPNVSAAYVRVLAPSQRVGTVFIDIFKEDRRPHHVKNVAMVYTVGCQRRDCSSDGEFLDYVRAIAGNVCAACCEYNTLDVLPLEMVRICLISGGAFAGKVPKAEVAEAIILGLLDGSSGDHSPTFEFSYDGDEFQAAWKRLGSK